MRLAPGNDDIRYNLSVAEARTKDNIEDIPEFFFVTWMRDIRHMMGCTAWSLLSLALLACMLGLFLVYLLAQRISLRKAGFYGTVVAALLFMLTTWFAVGERREMLDDTSAVVMTASTAVEEFARQVVDRPLRAARGYGRDDHRPASTGGARS